MQEARADGLKEWRDNYPLAITCFFGVGVSVFAAFSVGMFIEPIEDELKWGRGEISSALLVMSVSSIIGSGFVGWLIDRFGVRRVGIPGVLVYCVGLASLGATGTQLWQWWTLWGFVALGRLFVDPTLWATAISQKFDRHRGLALATTMCGSGVVLMVLPLVTTELIAGFGWRETYTILGLGALVLVLPLVLLFFRGDDAARQTRQFASKKPEAKRLARQILFRQLLSFRFIRLALACFLLTVATMGIQVHFVPLAMGGGLSREAAASMAGLIGVGAIAGRLTCGFLLDRLRGQLVGAAFFVLPVFTSFLLIQYSGDLTTGSIAAFVHGLSLGAELDALMFLIGRYYGLNNYAALVGTVMGGVVLAVGIGPTIAGTIHDMTGSYDGFVMMAIACFAAAAILVASLGDYEKVPER